jgi:hypothetical protein
MAHKLYFLLEENRPYQPAVFARVDTLLIHKPELSPGFIITWHARVLWIHG